MTSLRTQQRTGPACRPDRPGVRFVLVTDSLLQSPLRGRRLRCWHQAVAGCRSFALDGRLAAGTPADSEWLLAVRARTLVSPASRDRLADDLDHLLSIARTRPRAGSPAPVCRDRVAAAASDIRLLQRALRVRLPVPVRGVAMARQLLADAASPVYDRRSPADLRLAVQEAISQLDPSADLLPGLPR